MTAVQLARESAQREARLIVREMTTGMGPAERDSYLRRLREVVATLGTPGVREYVLEAIDEVLEPPQGIADAVKRHLEDG